jgi:hypothetical protein
VWTCHYMVPQAAHVSSSLSPPHYAWGQWAAWKISVLTFTELAKSFIFTQFETHSFELDIKRVVALIKDFFSTISFQWQALQLVVHLTKGPLNFALFCYKPNIESVISYSNNVLQCFLFVWITKKMFQINSVLSQYVFEDTVETNMNFHEHTDK